MTFFRSNRRLHILKQFIAIPAILGITTLSITSGQFSYNISKPKTVEAQVNAAAINEQINRKNAEIKQLEAEISQYQKQIEIIGKSASSLSSALSSLDLTQKKLNADLQLTQKRIDKVELDINNLSKNIGNQTESIEDARISLSKLMQTLREYDNATPLEAMLGTESLAEHFDEVERVVRTTGGIRTAISELRQSRTELQTTKDATELKRKELVSLRQELDAQRRVVQSTANEKKQLLAATKNQESAYKTLVADRQAKREAFEKEILAFEAALKIDVNTTLLPTAGSSVLKWPLERVIVTQYFGNTAFSTQNPQIYNGKGHTGVDLGAPIGTAVKSAMTGVIAGTGNTDLVPGCFSFGKWVMVKHPNGLSTLYAHLSVINVASGQDVVTGQIIGYSGNTGYSTGPHLHFGVYATEGTRIQALQSSTNCKNAVIPVADFKAYLNPLSYL
ncbi:MAG: peptidoglycan DD-metalloendopeptidase family protein [Patescibacteria group bacterium]